MYPEKDEAVKQLDSMYMYIPQHHLLGYSFSPECHLSGHTMLDQAHPSMITCILLVIILMTFSRFDLCKCLSISITWKEENV